MKSGNNSGHIPPLRNGDHLDRAEFQRRYEAMPQVKKAELIERIVFMPDRVPLIGHGAENAQLSGALGYYSLCTPGVQGGAHSTVRLDEANELQPDSLLLIEPARGGRCALVDGFITGTPELIAEVAYSKVSIEYHRKMGAYWRHGLPEYVVWRTEDQEIDWFILRHGQYERLSVSPDGIIRSEAFPGLWLDVQALVADDPPRVLAALEQGIASPEHAAFVAGLNPPTA